MGGQPSQWATFGEVIRLSDGERRGILDQTGTTLTLDVPFRELVVGDALQVWAGCDLTIETCLAKFGNVPNFGGHPDIGIRRTTAGPIPKKSFIQRIIDHTDGDL
jgi:hypothetical protein